MQSSSEPTSEAELLRMAVESAPDAIMVACEDAGRAIVTYVNSAFTRLTGYSNDEIVGKPATIIEGPESQPIFSAASSSQLQHEGGAVRSHTIRYTKDGAPYCADFAVSCFRSQAGDLVYVSIERQISSGRETEEELKEERRKLQQLVEERTADLEGFTYSVAHDLRAPLRAILASSMVLLEDYGPELPAEAKQELERQSKAATRLNRLVDELLKHSRIAKEDFEKRDVDMSRLAQDCLDEVAAGGHCHPSDVTIQPGMRGLGDRALLRLVFQNLVQNACKFAKPGMRPEVQVGQDDRGFYVRDHGRGFPKEAAERIFRPFERLVRDSDVPGTGIGLANVKRVIDRHGGRIWAEGEKNVGATIRFTLPER